MCLGVEAGASLAAFGELAAQEAAGHEVAEHEAYGGELTREVFGVERKRWRGRRGPRRSGCAGGSSPAGDDVGRACPPRGPAVGGFPVDAVSPSSRSRAMVRPITDPLLSAVSPRHAPH